MEIPTIQQLIDAGVEFTEVTREEADAFVKQLVDKGEVQRRDAERVVQELVDRGRETSERIAANVQREVSKQVAIMSERFDELEKRFEALTEMLAERVPSASALVVVRKTSARKAPAKKAAAAKKAPAKKAAAKAPAKKAAARRRHRPRSALPRRHRPRSAPPRRAPPRRARRRRHPAPPDPEVEWHHGDGSTPSWSVASWSAAAPKPRP